MATPLNLCIFGLVVSIRVDATELVEPLLALTASFQRADRSPDCIYELRTQPPFAIYRDGELIRTTQEAIDLLAVLEFDLHHYLIRRSSRKGWLLHAAALSIGERAIVLAGVSGSGKSTLSFALIQEGAQYLTDDCVLIDDSLMVYGLSRPLSFDAHQGPKHVPAGFSQRTYPIRLGNDEWTEPILLHPGKDSLAKQPVPLGGLGCLSYRPDETTHVASLSEGQALSFLWQVSHQKNRDALERARMIVSRTRLCKLSGADLEQKIAYLREFCAG